MAKLPRSLAYAVAGALFALAPAAGAVELEGTWHVLVHYTDDNTANPDQPRWEDRL